VHAVMFLIAIGERRGRKRLLCHGSPNEHP